MRQRISRWSSGQKSKSQEETNQVVEDVVDVLHGSGESFPFLAVVHEQIVVHLALGLLAQLLHVILQEFAQPSVELLTHKIGTRDATRLSARRGS